MVIEVQISVLAFERPGVVPQDAFVMHWLQYDISDLSDLAEPPCRWWFKIVRW